jgi:hypothetical protein
VKLDVRNFLAKNTNATGLKFVNYGVKDGEDFHPNVLETKGTVQKAGVDLGKVGPDDKLVIFGHGDSAEGTISEYDSSLLVSKLVMWGLKTVGTIYVCACEMGLGGYPRELGMGLDGLVTWKEIRAPKGFVQISAGGRKEVFKDEDKTTSLAKGANKTRVTPKDCQVVF